MSKCCFLYFVTARGGDYPVKIGLSDKPDERLRELQMCNPISLEITELLRFRSREEAFLAEQTLHAVLCMTGDHLQGEWFRHSSNVTQIREMARCLAGRSADGFVDPQTDLQSALKSLALVRSDGPDEWAAGLVRK